MQEMELAAAFNVALHVPCLSQPEQRSVLEQLGAFSGPDVSCAVMHGRLEEGRAGLAGWEVLMLCCVRWSVCPLSFFLSVRLPTISLTK